MESLFDQLIPFDEPQELEEETTVEETTDEEEVEQTETSEDADDRVLAIYSYLTESNFIDEKEGFKGKPEELEEILEQLPTTLFDSALQEVHTDGQDLLNYAFKLGKDASIEKLKAFFDTYINQDSFNIEEEEGAYEYLKSRLSQTGLFKTEAKLIKHLEDLQEDDELIETAKELRQKEEAELATAKKAELERIEAEKQNAIKETQAFYNTITEQVKTLNWDNTRKSQVLKNINPNEVARKNQLIVKSPMALIQLADIYSRFDEKTGIFDLTDYELKLDSKETKTKKDQIIKSKLESSLAKIKQKSEQAEKQTSGFLSQFTKYN